MSLFILLTLLLAPLYFLALIIGYRWRTSIGPRIVQCYATVCLVIFRVRIAAPKNRCAFRNVRRGILIVANHSNFLDIFVLSSVFGGAFVSKAEVRNYPIIGQIATLMGNIFLDRDSRKERLRLIKTIARSCSDRIIVVFPQGTTSRAAEPLPFNRGIFKAIELNPEISLLPVTLSYREEAEIAWQKFQSLAKHVMQVSSRERVHVTVTVHPPVCIEDYRGRTSADVCSMVEQIVLQPLKT